MKLSRSERRMFLSFSFFIVFSACFYTCAGPSNQPQSDIKPESDIKQESTGYILEGHENGKLKEVEIDGCQYLFGPWRSASVLTHKGNCKNPIHIHNGGDNE